ncbi:radical SAM/SPASM domain-containing protein [Desulfonatronovibrio hydrogenovorans]|uniref:radical SAM/SPASM domain-containing protein n=1 Tax=Desulfonatronovibrio hydrogenovorans TaxID=53245 RepID=UPI00049014B1|nr:radical SAM/SPASM domain-containing protein [Desulfonatronovibrio hydrogenovorans]
MQKDTLSQYVKRKMEKSIANAEEAMNKSKWAEAALLWQEIIKKFKNDAPPKVFAFLSMAYRFQNDIEKASRVIVQGVENFNNDKIILREYKKILQAQKKGQMDGKTIKISQAHNTTHILRHISQNDYRPSKQDRYSSSSKKVNVTHLEITTKVGCQNMCPYCPQDLLINSYKKISDVTYLQLSKFKNIVDNLPRNIKINFTGFCEPFLNKSCIDMIEYANSKNREITISTTISGLQMKHIDRLEKIPFSLFAIHMPSKNDKFLTSNNYKQKIKKIIDSNISNKSFHCHGKNILLKEIIEHDNFKIKFIPPISRSGNLQDIKTLGKTGPVTCKRNYSHPVLLPNGDLVICCMDYGLKFIIGNITKNTLNEIYSSDKFIEFLELNQNDTGSLCHKCDAYGVQLSKSDAKMKKHTTS